MSEKPTYAEREVFFREMAENIREVFWLFDWEKQKVIYVSPAYETVWGRSIKDLYNRYEEWAESIYPPDSAFAQMSFQKILETGGGESREYRIVRPDGTIRWVCDRGFAIRNAAGEVVRIASHWA
jgi:PAS domain S-box-containing protein